MTNIVVEQKLEYYTNKIVELENIDINEEVEKRLQEKRLEITEIVKNEINADLVKCKHYVEILNTVKDELNLAETNSSNSQENSEEVVCDIQENNAESAIEGV